MKIGLRGGHSSKVQGAVGIVNEYGQMQQFYIHVSKLLIDNGHEVINCNSNAATQGMELAEGVHKANSANVDLFISLHMNSYDGKAHGTECHISSTTSRSFDYAKRICSNFEALGFNNRGVKVNSYYEMKNVKAPNIIFEICFLDSKTDIDIYNKYSWEELAHALANAIDNNISFCKGVQKMGYIVTNYLPAAYSGYKGIDIKKILESFEGVKAYILGNDKGVWIETEYITMDKCNELKNAIGSLFYSINE